MRASAPWLAALVLSSVGSHSLGAEPAERVPWTTSRFAGTPDPPPPYTVKPAFPKLSFDRPVLLCPVPGTDRLLVAEMGGKIRAFADDPGADRATVALDLAQLHPDFTALYGLAFHPRFEQNREVYVCYVLKNDLPDGSKVARFRMRAGDPAVIDPASEEVVLTFPSGGHNGGCLEFGNDGYLYISTGDGAGPSPPDPLMTGQDVSDLLSSILRIDVDHRENGRAYAIPADNPFRDLAGARPEIWAYGFRNPWRMSIDRKTGDLWVGDVGWELWELIYRVERGGNYGWSVMEGRQTIHKDAPRGPTPVRPPTADHPHSEAASITGGYVYRGQDFPSLVGTYVYGDYQSGKVWGLRHDGQGVTWRGELADTGLRLVAFAEDHRKELLLIEYERSNQVYRLVPNPRPNPAADFPRQLSRTGLFRDTREGRVAPGVMPYTINAEAWADGASAQRWLAIPGTGRITIDEQGVWRLPEGSVVMKTVSLDLVAGDPRSRRRVETQILHLESGSWRPYTYAWNDEQDDATLADASGGSRVFEVRDPAAPEGQRRQVYRIASRAECALCHNPWVGDRTASFGHQSTFPLTLTVAQLNRGDGNGSDSLRTLERLGYFTHPLPAGPLPRLADPYDESAPREARVRAYFQVNCAHCHQFNAGGAANILLSADLPLSGTQTVGVKPIQGTFGIPDARIIAPGEPERSVLLYRLAKTGPGRMPRMGSSRVDDRALRLIAGWIAAMPDPSRRGPETVDLAPLRDLPADPDRAGPAIDRLTGSTSGALRLALWLNHEGADPALARLAADRTREHPSAEVRDLFERWLPDRLRVERLGESIDPETILALAGDVDRGRAWFASESATQCKTCHRIEGVGQEVGPDLSAIGAKYPKRDLLRHLLEPSREVDPKYRTLLVETTDGRVVEGLLAERGESELVLRDAKGQTIRLPRAEIEREAALERSLMPDGLLRDLTAQQAADLLEYLASRKPPAR
jgi:putative heme-binding domain-containing protein